MQRKFHFLSPKEIEDCIKKKGFEFTINYVAQTLKFFQWKETGLWENPRMRKRAQELSLKNIKYEQILATLREKHGSGRM